jgi:hypothetical protein
LVPVPTWPQLPQDCIDDPQAIIELDFELLSISFSRETSECQTFPHTPH